MGMLAVSLTQPAYKDELVSLLYCNTEYWVFPRIRESTYFPMTSYHCYRILGGGLLLDQYSVYVEALSTLSRQK